MGYLTANLMQTSWQSATRAKESPHPLAAAAEVA
jgi:hypothetical protein